MQQKLQLVIGDRNLSSWSMRAWLVAKISEISFEEILVPLDQPETQGDLLKYSPSKKVPCLITPDIKIWDSLSIAEYFAELAPQKNLWPIDPNQKALARSYSCEMHSGFQSLRSQMSMDIRLKMQIRHLSDSTIQDIKRILSIWTDALNISKGPFLFGNFGIVDAFYTPVVFRFQSYGIRIESSLIKKYMENIENHPAIKEWTLAALEEKSKQIVF